MRSVKTAWWWRLGCDGPTELMGEAPAKGWHTRFFRLLTRWTIAVHVPWALAVGLALRPSLGDFWLLVVVVACLLPTWALGPLVERTLPDRPRPAWRVHLLERPFLVHWSATHLSLVGWLAGVLVWASGHPLGARPDLWALAAYAAAAVVLGWGAFVTPFRLRVRRIDLVVPGLPQRFEGYRIAHLSDLHVGSFTSPETVARWVERVRRVEVDLTVVTGDLVTSGVRFHGVIADLLGRLRGTDGVLVVAGNHDYFGEGRPLFGELRRRGVQVLQNEVRVIERGGDRLIVAGMDDGWTGRGDLDMALRGRPPGVTVLLAHDPAVFDEIEGRDVSLVLSGHTHGGQLAVPGLARWLNLTRGSHRYQLGVYRRGGCTLVVSGGMGCTGLPIRVGVVPEVLILQLVPGRSSRSAADPCTMAG